MFYQLLNFPRSSVRLLQPNAQKYNFRQTCRHFPPVFWGEKMFFWQKIKKNQDFLWQFQKKQYFCSRL